MAMSLKDILVTQATLPSRTLGGTPIKALGDGITSILSSISSALPAMPAMPAMPAAASAPMTQVKSFIKSIEEVMPATAQFKPPSLADIIPVGEGGATVTGGILRPTPTAPSIAGVKKLIFE